MSAETSRLPIRVRSLKSSSPARTGILQISTPDFSRRREREQVAAVCYRVRGMRIEFLLVQTRGGRWTFPKGGAEPGLTYANSAALEAFEEAGVQGRTEEVPFVHYARGKSVAANIPVKAFLCEVLHLADPQERNRNRTWFSPQRAKFSLRQNRKSDCTDELVRVVDRAVARIQRLRSTVGLPPDPLQKVQFDAYEGDRFARQMLQHLGNAGFPVSSRIEQSGQRPAALNLAIRNRLSRSLRPTVREFAADESKITFVEMEDRTPIARRNKPLANGKTIVLGMRKQPKLLTK